MSILPVTLAYSAQAKYTQYMLSPVVAESLVLVVLCICKCV